MKFSLVISPDNDEEIIATVHEKSELTEAIERLVREYSGDTRINAYSEKLGTYRFLDYAEIECITVEGGRTYVVASDGEKYVSRLRLYELERCLPSCFIRINKSAIANEKAIKEFRVSFSGGVNAHFRSGYVDYVSRRCFADIKRRDLK